MKKDGLLKYISESDDSEEVKNLRKTLLDKVGEKNYSSWFKDATILTKGKFFVLYVKNQFSHDMIKARFFNLLYDNNVFIKVM